jgi:hypothetical protein
MRENGKRFMNSQMKVDLEKEETMDQKNVAVVGIKFIHGEVQ